MACCRQATSHCLSQCWPRSSSPYGVTGRQIQHWGSGWLFSSISTQMDGCDTVCLTQVKSSVRLESDMHHRSVILHLGSYTAGTHWWAHYPNMCKIACCLYMKNADLWRHYLNQRWPSLVTHIKFTELKRFDSYTTVLVTWRGLPCDVNATIWIVRKKSHQMWFYWISLMINL